MIIYWLAKIPAFVTLRVFFKRLVFINKSRATQKGPVIIAPNHSNALIDPIIFGSQQLRPVNFLARGDVFKKPLVRWVLTQLNIAPVFRLEEGADQLHKNEETFVRCNKMLASGDAIVIFPEAICVQEKKIRKLRKGLARIAFRAEEENGFKLGLRVVPTGLNYSNQNKFRSTLLINYGEPILVKNYQEQYLKDKARAINEFTRDLEKCMQDLVIDIHHKPDEKTFDYINEMLYKPQYKLLAYSENIVEQHKQQKTLSKKLAQVRSLYPFELDDLGNALKEYFEEIKRQEIKDFIVRDHEKTNFKWNKINELIFLILGLPVYWLGYLLNYPPLTIGKKMAYKKVKFIEFFSSVWIAVNMFTYLFWIQILLVLSLLTFKNWFITIGFGLLMVTSGVFAMYFLGRYKKIKGRWRWIALQQNNPQTAKEIVDTRQALIYKIEKLNLK